MSNHQSETSPAAYPTEGASVVSDRSARRDMGGSQAIDR
jgi:hypothetical protein